MNLKRNFSWCLFVVLIVLTLFLGWRRISMDEYRIHALEQDIAELKNALGMEEIQARDTSNQIKQKIQTSYNMVMDHEPRISALESGLAGLSESMANMGN